MFKLVLALICALLIALFAVQNAKAVIVSFLVWRFETSLVLVILGSAALGAIAVFLLGTLGLIKQKRDVREANQRIQQLESELEHLQQKRQGKINNEISTKDQEGQIN